MDNKAPDAFRTISEVADELDVPQHVLRFWESRFHEIRPMKRGGGRRYYRPDDVDLLRGIRHLLYGEGYTIRGVQRILREQGQKFVQAVWETGAEQPPHQVIEDADADETIAARPLEEQRDTEGGLRDRLASLIGRDLGERGAERREPPPMQSAPVPRIDPADRFTPTASEIGTASGFQPQDEAARPLARDDLRKLQAALHELVECRRLIDAAAARR